MKQETLEQAAQRIFDGFADITKPVVVKRALELVKWQQEQMYSEEEVKNLFNQYKEEFSLYRNIQILPAVFEEWFEQFKKK